MTYKNIVYDNDSYTVNACDRTWECCVHCKGDYTFTPGRDYMSNGDPGYPDDEDFDMKELEVTDIYCADTAEPPDADQRAAVINAVEQEMFKADKKEWL